MVNKSRVLELCEELQEICPFGFVLIIQNEEDGSTNACLSHPNPLLLMCQEILNQGWGELENGFQNYPLAPVMILCKAPDVPSGVVHLSRANFLDQEETIRILKGTLEHVERRGMAGADFINIREEL